MRNSLVIAIFESNIFFPFCRTVKQLCFKLCLLHSFEEPMGLFGFCILRKLF